MLKKAKCGKCVHCKYENLTDFTIGCDILGETEEKCLCRYFMKEKEYKTALESLKLIFIKEIKEHGRN